MELEWLEERYKKAEAITQRVQKNWLAFDSESGKDIDSFSLFKQKFVAQIDSQKNTIEQLKLTMAKLARLTLEVKSLRYVSNGNDGSEDNENTQCMNRELKQVEELCFQTREQLDVCIMQAHYSTEALLNACHILGHSQLVNSEGQPLNPIAIDNMEHSLQELTRLFVDAKFRDDIAFSESARAIDKLFESKSVI